MTTPEGAHRENMLQLRARMRRRKPKFVRQESWKYVRLKENWRKPHGLDNKVRKEFKGWPPKVAAGYMGPKIVRGLHPSGYEEISVRNVEELKKIDVSTQAARISHTVGKRKRAVILAEARKREITVLNLTRTKENVEEKASEKEVGESEETPVEATESKESKSKRRSSQDNKKGERER